jgi:hypothetical protein
VSATIWQFSTTCPAQWLDWIRPCNGGVFQTSAGLLIDAPEGTALYGRLVNAEGKTIGIALGVRHGCRLAMAERHAHFPTLPALAPGVDAVQALEGFETALKTLGMAEVTIGSYDATYTPLFPGVITARLEYVLPISPSVDSLASLKTTHRRHVRRGEREGWTVKTLHGEAAEAAILGVQQFTAKRATARARGFVPVRHATWARGIVPLIPFPTYGLAVFAAYHGAELLSSVLIGWAGERAFYLVGGSTPVGYQSGAAAWLHVRIINTLVHHGIRTYNFGGTTLDAANASDPGHGLYRFKTGFGVTPVERRGVHWVFRPGHLRLHRLLTYMLSRIDSSRR